MKKLIKTTICVLLAALILRGAYFRSDGYVRGHVVKILNENGALCSAEQVEAPSGRVYVLSAAHCLPIVQDGYATAIDEQGKKHLLKLVAEDPNSDLLLFEGIVGMGGLSIASESYKSQHVRAFTHGAGMDTYKMEGELIQDSEVSVPIKGVQSDEDAKACASAPKYKVDYLADFFSSVKVCVLSVEETISTVILVPGSSGGVIVNDAGEVVGVASAIKGPFSYLVRLKDIKQFIKKY